MNLTYSAITKFDMPGAIKRRKTTESKIKTANKPKLDPLNEYQFKTVPELQTRFIYNDYVDKFLIPTLYQLASEILNQIPLPDAINWSNRKVIKWLCQLKLPQYIRTFKKNYICGKHLLFLNIHKLLEMNIHYKDHIDIILTAIHQLFNTKIVKFSQKFNTSTTDEEPLTYFKMYRSMSGPKYENKKFSDFLFDMKIITQQISRVSKFTHWQYLEESVKLLKCFNQTDKYLYGGDYLHKHSINMKSSSSLSSPSRPFAMNVGAAPRLISSINRNREQKEKKDIQVETKGRILSAQKSVIFTNEINVIQIPCKNQNIMMDSSMLNFADCENQSKLHNSNENRPILTALKKRATSYAKNIQNETKKLQNIDLILTSNQYQANLNENQQKSKISTDNFPLNVQLLCDQNNIKKIITKKTKPLLPEKDNTSMISFEF